MLPASAWQPRAARLAAVCALALLLGYAAALAAGGSARTSAPASASSSHAALPLRAGAAAQPRVRAAAGPTMAAPVSEQALSDALWVRRACACASRVQGPLTPAQQTLTRAAWR
jgi:hypothetical protein